jgi:hypothetical protein
MITGANGWDLAALIDASVMVSARGVLRLAKMSSFPQWHVLQRALPLCGDLTVANTPNTNKMRQLPT